jgi:salicylate hydroxylase
MVSRNLRIALVGGGLGGLAAAIALSRRGFDVRIFEQSNEIKEVGAGITLTPNAVKILYALGLEAGIKKHGFEPESMVTRNWNTGHPLSRVESKGITADRFGAGLYHMHRADLLQSLFSALPKGILRLDARCTSVASCAGSAVVTMSDGSEEEADLIVGCDGIHSAVRSSLYGTQPARFTGNMCWRGLVPVEMLPLNHVPPDMTAWIGRRGHVVTYYLRDGELVNVVAIRETETWVEESWSVEAQPQELMSSYAGVHRDLRIVLDRIQHCFKWGLFDRDPLPSWNRGRVTLLGDAAHPMLPFLGQGAAMGFEDAWVLARELSRSCKDVPAALAAYEAERRPRTTKVQLAARIQGKSYHFNSPIARLKHYLRLDRSKQENTNLLSKDWLLSYDPVSTFPPSMEAENLQPEGSRYDGQS